MFVALSLVTILACAIMSEIFLSSKGFEDRKKIFACLVNYLEQRNVADECFGVAQSFDMSKVECATIIEEKRKEFYDDLERRLQRCSSIYGTTSDECAVLNEPDCAVKMLEKRDEEPCNNEGLKKKLNVENMYEFASVYIALRDNCEKLSTCFNCITEKLATSNYEEIRFHAAAVNLTVIDFKVWKYFSISPRVKYLESKGKELEKASKDFCKQEGKCLDGAVYF